MSTSRRLRAPARGFSARPVPGASSRPGELVDEPPSGCAQAAGGAHPALTRLTTGGRRNALHLRVRLPEAIPPLVVRTVDAGVVAVPLLFPQRHLGCHPAGVTRGGPQGVNVGDVGDPDDLVAWVSDRLQPGAVNPVVHSTGGEYW